MNKVITINLNGTAYQLEEGGYDALRAYLETAAARLQGNPDREEILSDIEGAIGEKFRALLMGHKTVVETQQVAAVLAEMGPIEAEAAASDAGATSQPGKPGPEKTEPSPGQGAPPKRLYRIQEGAMLAGVCNGMAAYFAVDPTIVRLAFVFLTLMWGTGLLVYIVMAFVVPEARLPEEKAAASGSPPTAQDFIRRAKEGYYGAIKGFPDRHARREWKRRFRREMRAHTAQWRHNWHGYWAEKTAVHPGMGFLLPFFSLLQGAVTVAWICAFISLLATGTLFGMALPGNVPVWVAAVILLITYALLTGPLKVARRLCYWGGGRPKWTWTFLFFLDALIWFAVVVALLWLGVHFLPELRDAVHDFPMLVHQAMHDIRAWWHGN